MEKEFDIEITSNESEEKSQSAQLPLNFLSFGEIENDDVKVYIKQDVYKKLEKFASSDTSKELGSILIGEYAEELGKTNVVISDFIEAKYTDASASTLTFTHETWEYVYQQQEKQYSDKKIIGWQHTHPNYGIFLSNYDMFIQENFFNLPFQVAYVIDPVQNIRGFFQWKNGKIEKLKGFYIYDEIGKPIKIEQKKVKEENNLPKVNKMLFGAVSILVAICLFLGFSMISLKNQYEERLSEQKGMVRDANELLSEQKELIDQQSAEITNLEQYIVDQSTGGSSTGVKELIEKIENKELQFANQETLLEELKDYLAKNENASSAVFTVYTVQSGDSIFSICTANNIDYYSSKNIILSLNGIQNENKIFIGQNLLLPTMP